MKAFLFLIIPNFCLSYYFSEEIISPKIYTETIFVENFKADSNSFLDFTVINKILKDPKNKITPEFKVPKYFYQNTRFWLSVYGLFSSEQVVIHHKKRLDIILDFIDFKELNNSNLNKYVKAKMQSEIALDHVRFLKNSLRNLAENKNLNGINENKIIERLQILNIKIPSGNKERKNFFHDIAQNLRVQTGQKNHIFQAILNSQSYLPFINSYFDYFEVPREIIALSYLESSFNPDAVSKSGAVGVWQFMPFIGKAFMKVNKSRDDRINPFLSTIGALHLLKQNYQILKRWDLAVTAYNSGTKHLLRAMKKLGKKRVPIEEIFKFYKSNHHGFASKNYYAGLLSLIYLLNYKKHFFPMEGIEQSSSNFLSIKEDNVNPYVTLCSFIPRKIYRILKKKSPDLRYLNTHLKSSRKKYPRGTILFSDTALTKKRYYKLTKENTRRKYPKNWSQFIKNYSCSTK